ncbi:MAG: hypothetical protein NC225_03510 [Clostridium sp.]|nr:hypothetical protein [Clostridium sp.]MCM1459822.1 hypothetical protein [Bacteroides sp.]
MNINYEKTLHKKVNRFKHRADKDYPHWSESNDNGEWEIGLFEFDEMCSVIFDIIESASYAEATEQMLDDMLFGIARDNECSRIVNRLIDYSGWYSVLCRKSLSTDYRNAKWQFAESLKDYKGQDNLRELIYEFLKIDDEYTERLALMSLAYIYPEQAEKYAIDFWHRDKYKDDDYGNEYQKIMVLHVLHTIGSDKLNEYLDLADQSKYRYLKENSKRLREELLEG